MLQVRVRGGGSGRYHSRVVMLPPRPAGAALAVSGAAAPPRPPRPPRPPVAAPSVAVGGAAMVGTSDAPPPPGPPAPPPMVRRIVLAPPFPNASYIRSMPLWLELMKPR